MIHRAAAAVKIRDIESLFDIKQVETLQQSVWGFSELDVVPLQILMPTREFGGTLIGAFEGETLVGFVYGFLGREHSHLLIHLHMVAVLPEYQNQGLGVRLQLAQRECVLAADIKRITWTFDPLQSRNAHLNFGKLGVVCDTYRTNFYGESTSSHLHNNGTDRLLVTWHLAGERVQRRIVEKFDGEAYLKGLQCAATAVSVGPHNEPLTNKNVCGAPQVLIEIPLEIDSLPVELARQWRHATRDAFKGALRAGYLVKEFCRSTVGVYILTRGDSAEDFA